MLYLKKINLEKFLYRGQSSQYYLIGEKILIFKKLYVLPEKGGGVLLDMSHELFKGFRDFKISNISNKISNLNILSDDIAIILGHTKKYILWKLLNLF